MLLWYAGDVVVLVDNLFTVFVHGITLCGWSLPGLGLIIIVIVIDCN